MRRRSSRTELTAATRMRTPAMRSSMKTTSRPIRVERQQLLELLELQQPVSRMQSKVIACCLVQLTSPSATWTRIWNQQLRRKTRMTTTQITTTKDRAAKGAAQAVRKNQWNSSRSHYRSSNSNNSSKAWTVMKKNMRMTILTKKLLRRTTVNNKNSKLNPQNNSAQRLITTNKITMKKTIQMLMKVKTWRRFRSSNKT